MPNLLSFSTYCVDLELRPLPSTGITRLPRYYEPLRHPKAPSLSLAGVWLIIADHAKGLPVLRALTLCTCCRHYPGAATEDTLRPFLQSYQPSPKGSSGRPARCPFRGLLSVHSRYGLHTRWIAYSDSLHWRLQPLRYLHDCSNCFRPERFSRVGLSPTGKAPPYHGAHPNRTFECFQHDNSVISVNIPVFTVKVDGISLGLLPNLGRHLGHRSQAFAVLADALAARLRRIRHGIQHIIAA